MEKELIERIAGKVFAHKVEIVVRDEKGKVGKSFHYTIAINRFSEKRGQFVEVSYYIQRIEELGLYDVNMTRMTDAFEALLKKLMDDTNDLHILKRSFWLRLKFLFTKNIDE